MKKYKVGVCGNFDTEHTIANGQTVKTINLWEKTVEIFGTDKVRRLDTFEFKRNPAGWLVRYVRLLRECENVVILPAVSAVKILVPIGSRLKKSCNCKMYYLVVGAWLGKLLKSKKGLLKSVKKLDGVFPETQTLKQELEELGLQRLQIFPNFKKMNILRPNQLVYSREKVFNICFFARVTEQKGIEELIQAVKKVNKKEHLYNLDIYGPVDEEYRERFETLKKSFPPYIKYKGVAESSKAAEIMKDYFLQVFPTKYKTEGIPGSIIDSYCAGVPVVASRWNSCFDIIDDNVTGLTFRFGNYTELEEILVSAAENPDKINNMKMACIKKAEVYDADNAMKILLDRMEAKI